MHSREMVRFHAANMEDWNCQREDWSSFPKDKAEARPEPTEVVMRLGLGEGKD